MSSLSNQLLPEAFYEVTSECLWAQAVSLLAILVDIFFMYASGAYMARRLKDPLDLPLQV